MTQYQFLGGYPYHPINDAEGFQIWDCFIRRMRGGQVVEQWDFNNPGPAVFPHEWLKQFWRDLFAAPKFERPGADQWATHYYTLLGGQVVAWREDRKESSDFIEGGTPADEFLNDRTVDGAAKAWLRKALAAAARLQSG